MTKVWVWSPSLGNKLLFHPAGEKAQVMIRPAGNNILNSSWKKDLSLCYEPFVHSHTYCIFIFWGIVYLSACPTKQAVLLWLFCYLVASSAKYIWESPCRPHLPPPPLSYNLFNIVFFFSWFLSTIILSQSSYCITCGSWIKFTSQVDPNPDLHLIKYRIKPKKSAT